MASRPGYSYGVTPSEPPVELIDLGDRRLRVRRLAPRQDDGLERTTLIFLHEGLGFRGVHFPNSRGKTRE